MHAIFGGAKFRVLDKTDLFYRRLQIMTAKSPEAVLQICDLKTANGMQNQDLVQVLVRKAQISNLGIQLLGDLHDAIARAYLAVIDKWSSAHPNEIKESKESRPQNYTPAMTRLKNISWPGYDPPFGGFCVKEPLVRLLQLATYPIDKFGGISVSMPDLKIGHRPIHKPGLEESKNEVDLYQRILALRSALEWEERYWLQLCEDIDAAIKIINPDK